MGKRGRHIKIPIVEENRATGNMRVPAVEEFNNSYSSFMKTNTPEFQGRPVIVYLRLLRFGIARGWFTPRDIYQKLLDLGFLEYPHEITDGFLLGHVLAFFVKDKNWRKEQLLRELLEGDESGGERKRI